MIAQFSPCVLRGEVKAPPSKSAAHRYLISAFLSGGECKIDNVVLSEDVKATINCLRVLGADIRYSENTAYVKPGSPGESLLNCSESGSTLRFLIPIALTLGKEFTFTGSKKLFERPLSVYENLAAENGFLFRREENFLTVKGTLKSGRYVVDGSISSQFVTGLLFALSTLENDSVIEITPPFESRSYVNITLSVMKQFGIAAKMNGNEIKIKGGEKYIPRSIYIEGDYSNAAYIDAFNCSGGSVSVSGLGKTNQGDAVYKDYFKMLDDFRELDISDCPDLGPVLISVATLKKGAVLKGTKRLAVKESDRGAAMAEELAKFGVFIKCSENEIRIEKSEIRPPDEILNSHNDHRIVMALCVLLSVTGGSISNAEAVNKSFPDYFDTIKSLGASVSFKED